MRRLVDAVCGVAGVSRRLGDCTAAAVQAGSLAYALPACLSAAAELDLRVSVTSTLLLLPSLRRSLHASADAPGALHGRRCTAVVLQHGNGARRATCLLQASAALLTTHQRP